MTSPIQGSARVRVEADTSRVVPDVLAAFRAAVAAAEQAVRGSGLILNLDIDPLLESVAQATAAVEDIDTEAAQVVLDADPDPLLEEVARAKASVDDLDADAAEITLLANARPLLTAVAQAQQAVSTVGGAGIDAIILDGDPTLLLNAVAAARLAVSDLAVSADTVVLDGDPAPLFEAIAQADAALAGLSQDADAVALGADPQSLLEAVAQANAALAQLAELGPTVEIDGDASPVVAEVARAEGELSRLSAVAAGVGTGLSAAFAVAAGAAVGLAGATIGAGAGFNILSQSVSQGLTAVLGTRDAARSLIAEVIELNQTAAFSRQAFLASTQQLVGFGVEADQVTGVLDAMQQAVVAVGGGEAEFAQLTDILARVASQGQVTGEALQRLGALGINLPRLIADTTGESVSSVEQAIAAGQVGLEEITQALGTRYAGAVEGYADTWAGAIGLVLAGLRNIGSALVEPFIGLETGGLAVQVLNDVAAGLFALRLQVEPLVTQIQGRLEPAVDRLSQRLQGAAESIAGADFQALFDTVAAGAPAFAGLAAALSTAGSSAALSAVGLTSFAGALNPVVAGVAAAVLVSPELRDVLVELVEALLPLAPALADTAGVLAGFLSTGLAAAATLLLPVVELIGVLVDAFASLPGPVQSATLSLVGFVAALRFGGPIGVAVAALTALGFVLETFGGGLGDTRVNVSGLAEDIDRLGRTGRVTAELGRLFGEGADGVDEFADKLAVSSAGFFDWSNNLNRTFDEINAADQAFTDLDTSLAQLVNDGANADELFRTLTETYQLNEEQVSQLLAVLPEYTAAAERQSAVVQESADRQTALAGSTQEATAAMREQADELLAQVDPIFALNQALQTVDQAQEAFNVAVRDFGPNSQEARDASFELTDAALVLQGAVGDASGTFSGRLSPALRDSLQALGLNADQLAIVEDAFRVTAEAGDDYAKDYVADVELRGDREARERAEALQRQLDNIERTVLISFETRGFAPVGSINIPGLAAGDVVTGPTLSWLGEQHRPEVVLPLTRPQRMTQLVGDPMVQAPIVRALGRTLRRSSSRNRDTALTSLLTELGAPTPDALVAALSGPQAGAGHGAQQDTDLAAELRGLRGDVQAMRGELRNARPINMPVTQAPGEDGEALAKRVVGRMALAGVT